MSDTEAVSDAEEEDQSPLLNELTHDQLKDVTWRAGTEIGDALWHLHAESIWKPNTTLPTGSDEDALVKETRKHVLKVLEEKGLLRVRDLELNGDARAHEAITVGRMHCFFKALLRIGHAAVQLYYAWPNTRDVLPTVQCDENPDAPPFAFPDLLEVSIELHFKAGLARAAEKALTNPKEPLCTIFEVPVKDSDDDDDESIDEGSDIGDNSNSDEEESESETEEEENEEDEPPTKKKK
jgi:hypothetical protein